MTSKEMRSNELFMRNIGEKSGKYQLHKIKKQDIDLTSIKLIACSDTRSNDSETNRSKGVHFFVDDYRFDSIYRNPMRSLAKFSQYAFVLTPDDSLYQEMDPWRLMESVAHSRWVGEWWQRHGLTVIPTISWAGPQSFEYCFDGIEEGSIVAIGMIGAKKQGKFHFMLGYHKMLEKIKPSAIICFGKPFKEMEGNIIEVDYMASRKVER